ncbi:hypothetical protein ILUMI_07481, partial [Ignelater luminosus]
EWRTLTLYQSFTTESSLEGQDNDLLQKQVETLSQDEDGPEKGDPEQTAESMERAHANPPKRAKFEWYLNNC